MIDGLYQLLQANVTLRLFGVVGLGYVVGKFRFLGGSLGVAAVLFVGLALGMWDAAAFQLPPLLATVGLALFVYTIGLASGPAVFRSLRTRDGLKLSGLTLLAVSLSALAALGMAQLAELPGDQAAGLFAGALTNTPALAAQLELRPSSQGPVVGYSLGYPFGVLGVLAVMAVISRWPGVKISQERLAYERKTGNPGQGDVQARNYRVTRLKPNGNQLEAGWLRQQTGLIVARRLHSGQVDLVEEDTVLALEDIILAVGTSEMHEKALEVLGEAAPQHLEQNPEVTYRRFFVSNKDIVGKPLSQIHFHSLHATVTRVRRGDAEMPASPGLILEKGDVVRVVAHLDDIPNLLRYFGDSLDDIADTDFLSISLGMVLGVLVGSLPLPLGESPVTLGVAGGTLLVGLLLGFLGRTGSVVWTLSREANLALRQFGLLLFLACVGIQAGGQFESALKGQGWQLLLAGLVITLTSAITLALALRLVLKEDLVTTLGVMAGAHTQPACLSMAENLLRESQDGTGPLPGVSVGYAAVFPVAMIAKILWGTTLLNWMT